MSKELKITVRFTEDHKEGRCWFDEKIESQWIMIPETKAACEGNSRSSLAEVIEKRRQNRLSIMQSHREEETFTV